MPYEDDDDNPHVSALFLPIFVFFN